MNKRILLDQSVLNCVREALGNALNNGHDFAGHTDNEVAGDIIAYDDTFSLWTCEQLEPYVTAVRQSLGTNGTMQ